MPGPPMPPGAAEPPMPGPPGSPGAADPSMAGPPTPHAPGADQSVMSRPPESPGSDLEATTDRSIPGSAPSSDRPATDERTAEARREPIKVTPTRTSAMWLGVWAGVLVVILLIIFVAQNTAKVQINFLWMSGQISLALAMLIAGVAGAIVAMAVAAARIIQLRRMVRRAR